MSPSKPLRNRTRLGRYSLADATVGLAVLIVIINGLLALAAPGFHHINRAYFRTLSLIDVGRLGRLGGLLVGAMLIYISQALLERKRTAWWIAVTGSIIIGGLHWVLYHSLFFVAMPALLLVVLLVERHQFFIKSAQRTLRQGILMLGLSLAIALLYGIIGFWYLDRRDFGVDYSLPAAARQTVTYYLIDAGKLQPRTRFADWFLDSLSIVGVTSIGFALFSVLQPLEQNRRRRRDESIHHEAHQLILSRGTQSFDAFKLLPDMHYFLTPDRQNLVAYGLAKGVMVALGDPIVGSMTSAQAIAAFTEFAIESGAMPAWLQISGRHQAALGQLGYQVLKVGEDAVVDTQKFYSETQQGRNFRPTLNKLKRIGWRFEVQPGPFSPKLWRELSVVSNQWLSRRGRRERGFTQGVFHTGASECSYMALLRDAEGRLMAFISFVGDGQIISPDLIRFRTGAPNGTMDYILAQAILWAHEQGQPQFYLGLAPLAGMGNEEDAKLIERIMQVIYQRQDRFFSFKGLAKFKAKFEPEWEPRYVAYLGSPATLPRLVNAVGQLAKVS